MVNVSSIRSTVRHKLRRGGVAQATFWAMIAEGTQLVTSLVGLAVVVPGLGTERYAGYIAVFGIIGVVGPPIAGGLVLAVMHHAVREREDLRAVARSALTLTIGGGAFLALVGWLASERILRSNIPQPAIVLFMTAEMIALPSCWVVAAMIQASERFQLSIQVRLAPMVMRMIGLLVLWLMGGVTLTNLAIVLNLSYLAAAIPAMVFASELFGFPVRPGRPRWRHLRSSITYGEGMSALSLQNDGDKVALDRYQFKTDGGHYGLAYRLIQLGFAPINGLLTATHTRFIDQGSGASGHHTRQAARYAVVAIVYGVFVSAVVWIGAPIVPALIGEKWRATVTMMRVLSPVVLLRSLGMFPLNSLIGLGKLGLRTIVLAVGAVSAVASYIAFVPRYSWKGAVAGSIISETVLAAGAWTLLVVLERRADRVTRSDALDELLAGDLAAGEGVR